MKTIMFYINSIHDGGAERVILLLSECFARIGYRSILVTSFIDHNEYPVPHGVERISIEQEEIKQSRLKRNAFRIKSLHKLIKVYEPQVLVSFMAEPCVRALIATIGTRTKNIISVRNDPCREYKGVIGKLSVKFLLPRAQGCVFQTEEAKKWFPRNVQKKSIIICNPVDKHFFDTKRSQIRKDIVTLGRLVRQKNHRMLIESFAMIADQIPDCNLRIYGNGVLKDELQAMINEQHLQDRVILMGGTDQVPEVLSNAQLFILSSDYEGMPNALMEAMTVGIPVISTDCPCGGPHMLIRNGIDGFLVPVGDRDEMAKRMCTLIQDEEANTVF